MDVYRTIAEEFESFGIPDLHGTSVIWVKEAEDGVDVFGASNEMAGSTVLFHARDGKLVCSLPPVAVGASSLAVLRSQTGATKVLGVSPSLALVLDLTGDTCSSANFEWLSELKPEHVLSSNNRFVVWGTGGVIMACFGAPEHSTEHRNFPPCQTVALANRPKAAGKDVPVFLRIEGGKLLTCLGVMLAEGFSALTEQLVVHVLKDNSLLVFALSPRDRRCPLRHVHVLQNPLSSVPTPVPLPYKCECLFARMALDLDAAPPRLLVADSNGLTGFAIEESGEIGAGEILWFDEGHPNAAFGQKAAVAVGKHHVAVPLEGGTVVVLLKAKLYGARFLQNNIV